MSILKVNDLVYDYMDEEEKKRALNGVNLEVEPGQFVAILGHNGSGKSSLAKQMNRLLLPTEGTVWVDGIDTKDGERLWEIRQKAGMVFQNPDNQIVATMVEEDVAFGPENLQVPTKDIWSRVENAMKSVGISKLRHKSPMELSGGQKQRVAIAGIIAMEPKCIVLDEPTAMLDPTGRKEVLATLHRLNRDKGITIILITHHMEETVEADRIFVLNHGEVVEQGTPRTVFSKVEELKTYGLEVPQVTELAFELKKEGVPLTDGILTAKELIAELERLKEQ